MKTMAQILDGLDDLDIRYALAGTYSGFVAVDFNGRVALFSDAGVRRPVVGDGIWFLTRDDLQDELARRAAKPEPVSEEREPKPGEWWRNVEDGELYVIAQTSLDLYAAVCVADGVRWAEPKLDARDVFNFEDALFAFYASACDEAFAKRAAEMGWHAPDAPVKCHDFWLKVRDVLFAAGYHPCNEPHQGMVEFIKSAVSERAKLRGELESERGRANILGERLGGAANSLVDVDEKVRAVEDAVDALVDARIEGRRRGH